MAYRNPSLTVDAVIVEPSLGIVLIRRGREPFEGSWALPGGFVEYGERCEDACVREVEEETGLRVVVVDTLGVYSDPKRDPRGHTVSVVYLCRVIGGELAAGDDAASCKFFSDLEGLELAFDHDQILTAAGFLRRAE